MTAIEMRSARGRRRSFDIDAAVDTAMRLFRARGYDGVGVAELVAELGIKPPSFYAAFGSKAGLFERVLRRYSESEANLLAGALAEGGGVAAIIERVLAHAARDYPRREGIAGCLVLSATHNSTDSEACALTAAARQAARAALRELIATEFPSRADDLADFVMIAMAGMSAAARDGAGAAALQAFAAMAGRAFRREAGP